MRQYIATLATIALLPLAASAQTTTPQPPAGGASTMGSAGMMQDSTGMKAKTTRHQRMRHHRTAMSGRMGDSTHMMMRDSTHMMNGSTTGMMADSAGMRHTRHARTHRARTGSDTSRAPSSGMSGGTTGAATGSMGATGMPPRTGNTTPASGTTRPPR